jgi:hypothetical protein
MAGRSSSFLFGMQQSELDEARTVFRKALGEYIRDGDVMKDLLLRTDGGRPQDRARLIGDQQERLKLSLQRYEAARQKYVQYVLADLAAGGGKAF